MEADIRTHVSHLDNGIKNIIDGLKAENKQVLESEMRAMNGVYLTLKTRTIKTNSMKKLNITLGEKEYFPFLKEGVKFEGRTSVNPILSLPKVLGTGNKSSGE